MVGNVIAVAMPMRPRTITSSSSEKPAACGGGNSMPSPFGRPGKANGLAPVHAGGEAADHLVTRRRGSSSLQRGCLRAVPAPREIPWLCVPPSPAVCPLERSYTVGGGKNYASCGDMHKRRCLERKQISHYALFTAKCNAKQSGGENPAACPVTALRRPLLAGRRALADSRTHRPRLVDEDGARHDRSGQVVVRHRRVPTTARDLDRGEVVAGRRAPAHVTRSRRTTYAADLARDLGAVLDGVGEERLLSSHQVTQVGLHGGQVGLALRIRELRDRDGGQDADNHHHDQQLNERKTLAVHDWLLCVERHRGTLPHHPSLEASSVPRYSNLPSKYTTYC